MTGCSYPPQALPKPVTEKGFQAKWNHLKTEDALPEHTSGQPLLELEPVLRQILFQEFWND